MRWSSMNWYVLFVLTQFEDRLCRYLHCEEYKVFSAKYEHYRRDKDEIEIKSLFPGYLFVKTQKSQKEFNDWLRSQENKKGVVYQLSYKETQAMTQEEIRILDSFLDDEGIFRMSYGHLENRRLVIDKGPLMKFDPYIIKYDKRNREVELNLSFIEQQWRASVTLIEKIEG